MLWVRRTTLADLNRIDDIFCVAKNFMKSYGNNKQWNGMYPSSDDVRKDIENNNAYCVVDDDNNVVAYFAFIIGNDKTYNYIENGAWLNDEPYGTIHRIASDNVSHGIFSVVLDYCLDKIDNVRIDTHEDNVVMRHILDKHMFKYCGIIYIESGDKRLAYQICKRS